MFNLFYNGKTLADYPIKVVNRPSIPTSVENITEFKVGGNDGKLLVKEGTYQDIDIIIEFVYLADNEFVFNEVLREVKKWLYSDGDNRLIFSDDSEFFYKVKKVVVSKNARTNIETGNFSVTFTCEGLQYSIAGAEYMPVEDVLYNSYDICHPVIRIEGEGVCQLDFNGKTFIANVGQNITIDSDRMISFKDDGTLQNTLVNGDYNDLWLKSGKNDISVTEGFDVLIKPNWRCL